MDNEYEKLMHMADGAEDETWADAGDDLLFGPEELVYKRDEDAEVHSGGFSVRSILLKNKIPPIITYNVRQQQAGGSAQQVSDLFADLVVPNWAYQAGGHRKNDLSAPSVVRNKRYRDDGSDSEPGSEESSDVLDEKLHQKLLDLVRERAERLEAAKSRKSRKQRDKQDAAARTKTKKRNVLAK